MKFQILNNTTKYSQIIHIGYNKIILTRDGNIEIHDKLGNITNVFYDKRFTNLIQPQSDIYEAYDSDDNLVMFNSQCAMRRDKFITTKIASLSDENVMIDVKNIKNTSDKSDIMLFGNKLYVFDGMHGTLLCENPDSVRVCAGYIFCRIGTDLMFSENMVHSQMRDNIGYNGIHGVTDFRLKAVWTDDGINGVVPIIVYLDTHGDINFCNSATRNIRKYDHSCKFKRLVDENHAVDTNNMLIEFME